MLRRLFTVAALGVLSLLGNISAAKELVCFNRDIRPILAEKCFACHGFDGKRRQAALRLDRAEGAYGDGESGQVIVKPGAPEESELWRRITATDDDERMPPASSKKQLTASEIALLAQWIREGARYEPHWALIVPRQPELPAVRQTDWPRNAIDRFVLARMEREGLAPAAEADRVVLVRRVTLDLTGLPPTLAEIDAFLADAAPQAYERLVDRLQATRAYAERRAQDWLDLARYADTRGFADDKPRDIWPFRDWVISALDRNQPFDQFTIEQLAGDMLPDATTQQRIASAFHRNAPQAKGETYPSEEYRLKGVVDRVNTTGTVWLGLTLGCAECHDHKFDPISQVEYFRLFALFNNIAHSGAGFEQGGPHLRLPSPAQEARLAELHSLQEPLRARLKLLETLPGPQRSKNDSETSRLQVELNKLAAERTGIEKLVPAVPVMEELPQPRETYVHLRGNFLARGDKVSPGVPSIFRVADAEQPRNRLEFARWLISGKHPLVARVVVNRFWQGYFGQGLVRTPGDFGLRGEWPTHPELLDWLASEFLASGWNMKAMHRLIVTSAAYRQAASISPRLAALDPENRWLARMSRVRLPAEQIRDQALAVSGLLKPRGAGPSVFPQQPKHYWEERALPGTWIASQGDDRYRRSLYTYWRRMALHPTLELLDAPSRTVCTAQRGTANLPTQALVTLNEPIFVEAAGALAGRIQAASLPDDSARLDLAFRLCLSRLPDADERRRCLAWLEQQTDRYTVDIVAAKALTGSPDPLLAAWSSMATVLMNLDETLTRP